MEKVVTKHEWGKCHHAPLLTEQYCEDGCGWIKKTHPIHKDVWYKKGAETTEEEPPCITRYPEQEASKDE